MAEYWEHGQYLVDRSGLVWRWCDEGLPPDCPKDHPTTQRIKWTYPTFRSPLTPLTPLFTAEQVEAEKRQARVEALRKAARIADRIASEHPIGEYRTAVGDVAAALYRAAEVEAAGTTAAQADAKGGTVDG